MATTRAPRLRRTGRAIGIAVLSALTLAVLPGAATARDSRDVLVQDRCDQETFDAAVEPGTCIGDGDVTFDEFLGRLNPHDGGHGAWRFSRRDVDLDPGQRLWVSNTGGEVHTFTKVHAFGGGIVPILNTALPPGTPLAVPVGDLGFIAPGQNMSL